MTAKIKSVEGYLGREFIITRVFAAPRELVFQAWTDARHLAQWWGPRGFTNPVCEWDVRVGGKIHHVMRAPNGADYPMGGEFREIVRPERLVLTTGALDEKGSMLFEMLHTVTLGERNGKTTLMIRSRVTKASESAARYLGGFEAGMTQSLERLAEHLKPAGEPLVVERVFDAPVEQVWRALTDVEAMRRWYFDLKGFQPVVGVEFQFVAGCDDVKYVHLGKVVEVVPGQKIAYTWRYENHAGDSRVTFELSPEGRRTRLKLTHEGLDSFPPTPAFARTNFEKGWTKIIGSALKDYLDTVDREIVIARELDAPRDLVWQAMTDPKHVVNWWGPRGFSTAIEQMGFRVGGIWKQVMRGPDGTKYFNEHVFQEIVKPERIVLSHGGQREDGTGVRSVATWTFEALAPKKTRVTIRMVFPTAEHRNFVVKEFGAIEGARQTLERLSEHLLRMSPAIQPFVITRVFNAPRELVWKAWTEREHLMKWFGPKGFTMPAARMDFRRDGMFHFCLCGPDGVEKWGKFVYREITAPERIVHVHSFSDEDGGLTRHPLSPTWPLEMLSTATFAEEGPDKTRLTIEWIPLNATEEELKTFEGGRPGMNQGWAGTFESLDAYLEKIKI